MDAIKGVILIVVVTAMLFVAVVKVVGGSSSSSASSAPRPGAPQVYRQINAATDCTKLQKMFDTAADNNDREPAGSTLFEVTLSYMNTADDRMRSLGCYG